MKDDARPVDKERAARAMRDILKAVGVDLQAQGMEKTPERVAKMYEYLLWARARPIFGAKPLMPVRRALSPSATYHFIPCANIIWCRSLAR